jgi:MOSC domain-containing protein YiiM
LGKGNCSATTCNTANSAKTFTVDGLPDDEVCIGDRYQIVEAVFEVTQPRVTCYRVGIRVGEPRMAALMVAHRRPGFYLRVITEGQVAAGQEIIKISADPQQISVAEIDALLYLPGHPKDDLERALGMANFPKALGSRIPRRGRSHPKVINVALPRRVS